VGTSPILEAQGVIIRTGLSSETGWPGVNGLLSFRLFFCTPSSTSRPPRPACHACIWPVQRGAHPTLSLCKLFAEGFILSHLRHLTGSVAQSKKRPPALPVRPASLHTVCLTPHRMPHSTTYASLHTVCLTPPRMPHSMLRAESAMRPAAKLAPGISVRGIHARAHATRGASMRRMPTAARTTRDSRWCTS
jgi:hypothetical protein